MIILAWNNRGMARSSACRNLKAMVRSLNPSCLFIQETKVGEEKLEGLVRNLGFVNQCLIPAIGTGGGLLLGWWKEVDLEVTVANQRLINALVFNEPLNQPWMLTFVHGPHSKSGRAPFLASSEYRHVRFAALTIFHIIFLSILLTLSPYRLFISHSLSPLPLHLPLPLRLPLSLPLTSSCPTLSPLTTSSTSSLHLPNWLLP